MNLCSNIPLRTREQHEHAALLWDATPEKQRATLRELRARVENDRAARSHALAVRRTMPRK